MTVYVLVREDQNEHGFVDTSVAGVLLKQGVARLYEASERRQAKTQDLVVEDDDSPDGEWEVSWRVEEHAVD